VPGSGEYQLTLATIPVDTDLLAIEITLIASPGEESAIYVAAGVIGARTYNSAGVLEDRSFTITVYDLNP
jgi:hypothetical protein